MTSFVLRRLLASLFVLLAATFVMYLLTAYSGDPLEELRTDTRPNREALIAARVELLDLDTPPALRYFTWLAGVGGCLVGSCDFGASVQNLDVNALLANSLASTLQLVTAATVLAIVVGVGIGVVTALRQYSGFDYTVTFFSFLFFSLPIFWVAVLLKQYIAIGFNDFLRDPTISPLVAVGVGVVSGLVWSSVLGGPPRRRVIAAVVAAVATAGTLLFLSATAWFTSPSLGPVVIAVTGAGIALGTTALGVGLHRRNVLYACLIGVALVVAAYYPVQVVFRYATTWLVLALVAGVVVVGGAIGWAMGGFDRWQSARTAALSTGLVFALVLLDRFMRAWASYNGLSAVNARPIATVGSRNPRVDGNFWITGLDVFTHLLLPTIALLLVSLATYSRYSRASMLEVMNMDYIRTARAKGLTERTVVVRHAFRNALIPLATIVAFDVGALIGGAVITEYVFGWTGMGQLFQQGLAAVDLNAVMAFFVVTALVAIVFNLVADLAYSALDPRIRVG